MSVGVPVALLVNVVLAIRGQVFRGIESDGGTTLLVLAPVPVDRVPVLVPHLEL